jgi:hypothetical protein
MEISPPCWYNQAENSYRLRETMMKHTSGMSLSAGVGAPARASLVCAIAWPLSLAFFFVVNILSNHRFSDALAVILALILLLAPPIGIITGIVGIVRLSPWRRLALVALALNLLWCVGNSLTAI